MSHELRTPLNAVLGYADLLTLGVHGPMNAEQTDRVTRIRRGGEHLLGVINDILNFARLEAGEERLHSMRWVRLLLLPVLVALVVACGGGDDDDDAAATDSHPKIVQKLPLCVSA